MRLYSRTLTLALILSAPLFARGKFTGYCQQANTTVRTSGQQSANKVQGSFPGCTVTVYLPGTVTLATIYSDNSGTPQANPFTLAGTVGVYSFYADNAAYDVATSGGGITPATVGSLPVIDPLTAPQQYSMFVYNVYGLSFTSACSAAIAASVPLVIDMVVTNLATQSCGANLVFTGNGRLRPNSGQILTLTGIIHAPSGQQLFDISASGVVLLPTPKQDTWINWFGADMTGILDSASACNAAWTAVRGGNSVASGVTVRATAGSFLMNSTCTMQNFAQSLFSGAGAATTFTWGGNITDSMFLVADCTQCEMRDFNINGSATHQLAKAIQTIHSVTGGHAVATLDRFININMEGTAGYITKGFYAGGGTDGNNDQQYLESVVVRNYLEAAFALDNTQVYNVTFVHCQFAGDGYGSYGVEVIAGGSFTWEGGGDGGGNTVADFKVKPNGAGGSGDTIQGGRYEGSAAFLVSAGTAFAEMPVRIRDVDWGGNNIGCSASQILNNNCGTPPGGNFITYTYAGNLSIEDSKFCIDVIATVSCTMSIGGFAVPPANHATMFNVIVGGSQTTITGLAGTSFNNANSVVASYNLNPSSDIYTQYLIPVNGLIPISFGDSGANNALVVTIPGITLAVNSPLCFGIVPSHTLQAGANTINLNGLGAKSLLSHFDNVSNIAHAYALGGQIQVCWDGAALHDMSQ